MQEEWTAAAVASSATAAAARAMVVAVKGSAAMMAEARAAAAVGQPAPMAARTLRGNRHRLLWSTVIGSHRIDL